MNTRGSFVVIGIAAVCVLKGCAAERPTHVPQETLTALLQLLKRDGVQLKGDSYRCSDMVHLVNKLRQIGKWQAIEVLQRYREEARFEHPANIFLICRCLFQNPSGWDSPALGMPVPPIAGSAMKSYPAFPIAFSNHIPFLLVRGYRGDGVPEQPDDCLVQCKSLDLIQSDLPSTGFLAAARSLAAEPRFRELYPDQGLQQQVFEMLLKQAQETDAGRE